MKRVGFAFLPELGTLAPKERQDLLRALYELCPEVEESETGYYLQLVGLGLMHPSENEYLRRVRNRLRAQGREHVAMGAAGGRFAARAAAQWAQSRGFEVVQVPPGEESTFIASLPLPFLPASAELIVILRDLGLRTAGDFAALPRAAVVRRFGESGAALLALAQGSDSALLSPTPMPHEHAVSGEFEPPLVERASLIEAFRRQTAVLMWRLRRQRVLVDTLVATMTPETSSPLSVTLRAAVATRQAAIFLELFTLALEDLARSSGADEDASVPRFQRLTVAATEITQEAPGQRVLFARSGARRSNAFLLALLRLSRRLSAPALAVPVLVPHDLPDRAFSSRPLFSHSESLQGHPARAWMAEHAIPTPVMRPPLGDLHVSQTLRSLLSLGPLRRVSPPCMIRISENTAFFGPPHAIRAWQGPFRLAGQWWQESAYTREYYRLLLENDRSLLIFRSLDPPEAPWMLAGVFD
ncbi:MAG: hypothetical protein HYV63_12340 [Candidatus Schekmanbacteria bacterium]|nr:hypothetical protein [Candidatus Schekmanbacteria bacterium]